MNIDRLVLKSIIFPHKNYFDFMKKKANIVLNIRLFNLYRLIN